MHKIEKVIFDYVISEETIGGKKAENFLYIFVKS